MRVILIHATLIAAALLLAGCSGSSGSSSLENSSSSSSSSSSGGTTSSSSSSSGGTTSSSSSSSGGTTSSSSSSSGGTSSSSSSSSSSSGAPCTVTDITPSPSGILWNVYDACLEPDASGSVILDGGLSSGQFTLETGTPPGFNPFHANTNGTVTIDSTTTGPTTSGSGLGGVPAAGDNVYARFEGIVNDTNDYPKTLTVLAGVTGNTIDPCASSTSRVLEIEMAFGDTTPAPADGGRIKAIIRENCTGNRGLQIESFDGATSYVAAMPDTSEFHIYHIAVTLTALREASVQVYIDGVTTPALNESTTTLRASSAPGVNYLRIGDGGGNQFRGTIDWIIWTTEAAYSAADLVDELPNGIGELGLYNGGGSATCVAGMSISNTTVDCEGETIGLTCPNDSEGQPPVFALNNATLKNVRIAASGGADGVHCISGNCVLENVIWEDVCEDAASLVSNGVTMTITGGSAFNDLTANGSPGGNPDKIFQHNSKNSTTIINGGFRAHGRNGKLWRACGDCTDNGGPRHLVVDDVIIEGIIGDVAGPNGNYGDTVTISNLQIENYTLGNPEVCLVWTGVEKGEGSSTQVGEQFNTATCIVDPSDITSFP